MKQRKLHYDFLRILCILFVVYNHTNERGYYMYAYEPQIGRRIFFIAMAALIAVAVPVFFMISGALLIPKEESLWDLFRKRILRMILVIVLFSVLQYAIALVRGDVTFSALFFLRNTIGDNIIPPYWYLYAYLAYLICLPLLRTMAKAMTNAQFQYLFALMLLFGGIVPVLVYPLGIRELNSFFDIPFFSRVFFYPMLGYYLEHRLPEEKVNGKLVGLWLVAACGVLAVFVGMTLYRNLPPEEFTVYDKGLFTCSLTMVMDVALYLLAKVFFASVRTPRWAAALITGMGSCVFGTYLLEQVIRVYTLPYFFPLDGRIGIYTTTCLWVVCVCLIGMAVTWVLKKIPGLKQLL